VAVSCRVLKLSRQPYYRWLVTPAPEADVAQAYRANTLFEAHRDDPEFGYRYLADEAEAAGESMAVRTAWRLCSANAWFLAFGKNRAKNGKRPGPPVHDDLRVVVDADGRTRHEFRADGPNQLSLTGVSEHQADEGMLYLCAIKDACSARIVGYSISSRMKARLAVDALEVAVIRRGGDVAGCVAQSDRGSQFWSKKFTRAFDRHGIVGSMGRVGAAGDNAAMESFFALLQKNVLEATRDQLRISIVTWNERTYHRRRRQARLGRLTPIEYEAISESPAVVV
jgi:putative transposase